jgi:hypothetical protein
MVSNKQGVKSFKLKKRIEKPVEDWIIVENTHEAIISETTFDCVQRLIKMKQRPVKTNDFDNIFSGLLICADCERRMVLQYPGKVPRYVCAYHSQSGNTGAHDVCTLHYTPFKRVYDNVLCEVNKLIDEVVNGSKIITMLSERIPDESAKKRKKLEKSQRREKELNELIKRTFEKNVQGAINDDTFNVLYTEYQAELKETASIISSITEELASAQQRQKSVHRLMGVIRSLGEPRQSLLASYWSTSSIIYSYMNP